ncbi:hypothetical protein ABZX92_29795 [Lentzea sp. NPDC006480]|uniref:hypothetical protein n=1 Tax=Lentzea sp. NPDC006480 TaxID=3157176 RepID=UPI0033B26019
MADSDLAPGTVVHYLPDGARYGGGHSYRDFESATKMPDGSWKLRYHNGETTYSGGPALPKPDPNSTPNTENTQMGDPWNIYKGSQPPFPDAPSVPGGTETPGKGVHVISVDAITLYAKNIRALLPVIAQTIKELDDLAARGFGPGNFGAANNFKTKVFGAGGGQDEATLLASTRQVFVEAETIINEVAARCDEIAQKYKTAGELAAMDASDFTSMVANVKAKVDNLPLGGAS